MSLIKKTELQDLTIDQIDQTINDIRKEIILIKIKNKTKQNIKPHELKNKKCRLAQLLTLKTLKQQPKN
uniref:Ribosomal protein L29 n=1 Tax=Gayliella sp. TaxID=2575623 RepID=A0A4D6WSE9_9FLOR|nr:ribosomal protein L29 [Gayliella sp.]